jgi:3-oxoacyl-[acyl-carrier protein] reductase
MGAKVAIVAGAGGALGHATAVTLAASGLMVVAVDRIAGEVGLPGLLVNTIGAFRPGDTLSTTPETLRLMIDVNLGPALWLSQAVAPHMRRQGSGAIVHVTARPGIEPAGGMAAYSASKAALVHLTRILDIELRPRGIRMNAVAPQLLDTPATGPRFRQRCWRTRSRQSRSPACWPPRTSLHDHHDVRHHAVAAPGSRAERTGSPVTTAHRGHAGPGPGAASTAASSLYRIC